MREHLHKLYIFLSISNYSIIYVGQVSIDELIIYFVTQIETFVPLSIAQ